MLSQDRKTTKVLDHNIFRPQNFQTTKAKNENEIQARLVFPFESQTYEANTHEKIVKCANVYYAFIALYNYKESSYQ